MIRTLLLASAAMVAAAASPARADCVTDALGIACAADATGPFTEARDGATVSVNPGVTVDAPNNTFTLSGAGVALDNRGALTSTGAGSNIRTLNIQGGGVTVTNGGSIVGSDRGVEVLGGPGFLTVVNEADAEIRTRRQAVRSLEAYKAATIVNDGLIFSQDGRAAQIRSGGSAVYNAGVMIGGEEVIEGREDFTLENTGTIAVRGLSWDAETRTVINEGAKADEDGVQFASGTAKNWGVILSTDDGVDLDEGLVHNYATGVIVSLGGDDMRNSGAVDVDARFEPSTGAADFRPAGPLTVINEGYMEGSRGVLADSASEAAISIFNSGVMVGRSGIAIDMAPNQGDTLVALTGGGQIFGDVLFGAGGDNTLMFSDLADGAGIFSKVSAREGGAFDVVFDGMTVSDILAFRLGAELFRLDVRAGDGRFRLNALGARSFTLDDIAYSRREFAMFLGENNVAAIPLPAAGWLLLAGLGGLVALRRRAA